MTKKIVFFCRDNVENIQSMEYYRQDVEALRSLGHQVTICTRYQDIPARFDVMYIWWWTYALYPVALARLTGRKALITGVFNLRFPDKSHGADYFARPWHQRLLIRLALKLADANLFISKHEFHSVPEHFGLRQFFYFPCAVGEEYFADDVPSSERSTLLNIAWSGSENLKRKGVWDILDAISLLRKRGLKVDLLLAGKQGDGYAALQQRIVDLGIQDCVMALGEVSKEEKLGLFAKAKLYLQPSYFEGFGLATAEAMAAGCCVITCDVGEVRNVVGDGGVYVNPGDPAGLADVIVDLLADQAKIDSVNDRAAGRLRTLFSFKNKQSTLKTILASLGIL